MREIRIRRLGALLLTLLALTGAALTPKTVSAEIPALRVRQQTLLARSRKKKKNTPTPAVTSTPAPAAAEEDFLGMTPTPVPEGPIIDPQSIADYLFAHGELPDNFITKKEARALGWDSSRNYVSDVAPGMSIGGDRFGNYEESLPVVKGRQYYEADCWYTGGRRNAYRIIYSDDGHVWYTEDHYQTFTELFPTVPAMTSAAISPMRTCLLKSA